jgi:hypothetical protein
MCVTKEELLGPKDKHYHNRDVKQDKIKKCFCLKANKFFIFLNVEYSFFQNITESPRVYTEISEKELLFQEIRKRLLVVTLCSCLRGHPGRTNTCEQKLYDFLRTVAA